MNDEDPAVDEGVFSASHFRLPLRRRSDENPAPCLCSGDELHSDAKATSPLFMRSSDTSPLLQSDTSVRRRVDLQSDAFSATPALRLSGEIYRLYRMARTMQMLDVIEDKEYLEHPQKEFVVSACFKGGGAGINEVLKELKLSDARKALFAVLLNEYVDSNFHGFFWGKILV